MTQARAKVVPIAVGFVVLAVLIGVWVGPGNPRVEPVGHPIEPPRVDRRSDAAVSPESGGFCALEIVTMSSDNAVLGGIEHCAYEVSSGRRLGCDASDRDGKAAIEWSCAKSRQVGVISASPDWVVVRDRLVTVAPNEPQSILVRMAHAATYLSGRVEDTFGGPVPSALVRVSCRDLPFPSHGSALVGLSVTDEDGVFRVGVPKMCDVDALVVAANGYASTTQQLEHQREDILVRLLPAGVIRGRVSSDDVDLSNALVTLRGASGLDAIPSAERIARNLGNGEFVFDAVPPGVWVVQASAGQQYGEYPAAIRLDVGEVVEGVEIRLSQAAAVEVVVSEALAKACDSGQVEIIADTAPPRSLATIGIDAAGSFRVDGLATQPMHAILDCEGYVSVVSPPLHEIGHRWKPEVPDGWAIMGHVVDADGSAMVGAGVWVRTNDQVGPSPRALTDETGFFTIRGLGLGPVTVLAQASKSSPTGSVSAVVEEQPQEVLIELPVSSLARGRIVTGEAGVAAYRVAVTTPTSSCRAASDQSGTFECTLAAEAGAPLYYSVQDHQGVVVATAEGSAGKAIEIDIPSWRLVGTVVGSEEGPYQVGAEVVVDGSPQPTPIGVMTDRDGKFELTGLSVGASYWLTAQSLSGNVVSAGPFVVGDRASLELAELAKLRVLVPCPGAVGQLRVSRQKTSFFPLLVVPSLVGADGIAGTLEVPAGSWYVGWSLGVGDPVWEPVTVESGAMETVTIECDAEALTTG